MIYFSKVYRAGPCLIAHGIGGLWYEYHYGIWRSSMWAEDYAPRNYLLVAKCVVFK